MKIRTLLASCLLLFSAAVRAGAWTIFDDFEAHKWVGVYYGDGWCRPAVQPTWGTYTAQNRNCLKLTSSPDGVCSYQPLATDYFINEDWSNVSLIKLDVYADIPVTNATVQFGPWQSATVPSVDPITSFPMSSTGTWQTYTWNYAISASSPVARLQISFANLGTNDATFYVDNLRLVLKDGTTHYWDNFDRVNKEWAWSTAGSVSLWNATPDYVTHNVSVSTANAGAGVLWWHYNGTDNFAQLASGVTLDWSSYNIIRADVRCSTTTIPIKIDLWFDPWDEETAARYVAKADTWQTLYWPMPAGAATNTVKGVNLRVCPDALHANGTFYIDNIYVGNTNLSVTKSTSVASALPDGSITYTITYKNSGNDALTNLQLLDVVPFNAYISASTTKGSADTVEYYVGGSWTSTYSDTATKIRWHDNEVPGDNLDQTVQYTVKLR